MQKGSITVFDWLFMSVFLESFMRARRTHKRKSSSEKSPDLTCGIVQCKKARIAPGITNTHLS